MGNFIKAFLISITVILLILAVAAAIMLFAFPNEFPDMYCHIFRDISECDNFEDSEQGNVIVTKYDTPIKDKNIKELSYEAFFAAEYSSPELSFEIFAYEFSSDNDAKRYFCNVTGKNADLDTNFSESGGLISRTLVVIDNTKAYVVHTNTFQMEALKELLEQKFSQRLEF